MNKKLPDEAFNFPDVPAGESGLSDEYAAAVLPEHVKALIEKRRADKSVEPAKAA